MVLGLGLQKRRRTVAPAAPAKPVKAKTTAAKTVKPKLPPKPVPLPPLAHGQAPGFDKRSHEKFREGKMPMEARIDLHGHTLEAAPVIS